MTDTDTGTRPVEGSGTFDLGGRPVHRLGFGAMRLTGPGIWGPPADPDTCVAVLRRAVELGVDFIDTADSYGPEVSEELVRRALHPYPPGLVIATKAGLVRTGPGAWAPVGRPEYLRQQCEMSLRRLGVERIALFQLHRIDPKVAADEQFGLLGALVAEGKVASVGLSEVSVDELAAARAVVPVVSVQNRFNLLDRGSAPVLTECERLGLGFIPWFPVASGDLARGSASAAVVADVCRETGATPAQVSLSWLLAHSPVMLPIPGTSSLAHLEENCRAATLELSDEQVKSLDAAGS